MELNAVLNAIWIGIIEGLTEFLPVSSTGHMLLTNHFFGTGTASDVFEIVIQLGAILAVVVVYFNRLWKAIVSLPTSAQARKFALSVIIAFIPSVVIGMFAHDFIKKVLFASPMVIAISLIVGGILLIVVERMTKREIHTESDNLPEKISLGIGLFQCLAMIPGVSRSGATICGALLMGVSRKAAAEFSFFLAIPTMLAASIYDVYKSYNQINIDDAGLIAIGFVVSFIVALLVVRSFIGFINKYGFTPFGWYRIALGTLTIILLQLGY